MHTPHTGAPHVHGPQSGLHSHRAEHVAQRVLVETPCFLHFWHRTGGSHIGSAGGVHLVSHAAHMPLSETVPASLAHWTHFSIAQITSWWTT